MKKQKQISAELNISLNLILMGNFNMEKTKPISWDQKSRCHYKETPFLHIN